MSHRRDRCCGGIQWFAPKRNRSKRARSSRQQISLASELPPVIVNPSVFQQPCSLRPRIHYSELTCSQFRNLVGSVGLAGFLFVVGEFHQPVEAFGAGADENRTNEMIP